MSNKPLSDESKRFRRMQKYSLIVITIALISGGVILFVLNLSKEDEEFYFFAQLALFWVAMLVNTYASFKFSKSVEE